MPPTAETSFTVGITPRSQVMNSSQKTPRCASYQGVWLRGVHQTAESITYQVSVLIQSFTNAIFLWCLKIFTRNWYYKSQIVQGIFFNSKVFRKNEVKRCSKYENRKNGHFRVSLTLQCASHSGVELHCVHPTAESDSPVCFPPRSQTPWCASHRWVKLHGVLHTTKSSFAVCITP